MKVLIVYHSLYGHTLQLARAVEQGVKSASGVQAVFRKIDWEAKFEAIVREIHPERARGIHFTA